ncbi:uncharacterized protein LOC115442642 [Manduca sexta]|uniref:uncharacterized protein LOC115442642 n=1 Tax=Manduca sexta TaxID=7130 RepID=UPI00188ED6E7|nr:uncharacterized protein LOC115442642 [Manduca sexta]
MDPTESENLMREYIKRFDRLIFLRLKYSGFANIGASILLSTTATQDLKLPEVITIVHFVTFANLMLINLTFFNRRCGYQILASCIEIDVFFGVKETSFMRDVSTRNLIVSCYGVVITSLVVVTYMYIVFLVSVKVHIIGSIYFAWLFCTYDDYCLFLSILGFLSMRVKYLNVAIMKLSSMNADYIPNVMLFDKLFWKKNYDDNIAFHTRAGQKEFAQAFRMIFHLLDLLTKSYKFALTLGVWTIVVGTFVSVQVFIIYIKSSHVDLLRASVVAGWAAGNWLFILLFGQQVDLFYQQVEQTVLICSYIQLKPNVSTDIHKLTKGVLRTLSVRNRRRNAGLFHLDTGLVFRIAASTFVYITVQLQMAFPSVKDTQTTANVTSTSVCEFMPSYTCPAI